MIEERNSESIGIIEKITFGKSPFLLAQKIEVSKQQHSTDWMQTECGDVFSILDTRMWLWFAEQCLQEGRQEEALRTYKSLVEHAPRSLENWRQIVEGLIEKGKTEEAQATLEKLKIALPPYENLTTLMKAQ